jgi:UDP-glucuronate decarboxylase
METPDGVTGPLNLGNPDECTVRELAERIRAVTGARCDIRFESLPEDDPRQRKPDIGLAREVLGWEPKVSLEEGLRRTVDYFDDLLRREPSG